MTPGDELLDAPDDLVAFNDWALDRGWGDGLPLIPPTPARVGPMIEAAGRDPGTVLARVAPRGADATVEKVCVNAVMAGCEPRHLPVLLAAVEAVCDPAFMLATAQTTTHPCGVMLMINGPAAAHAGIHGGTGAMGPGFRANAAIGRALRLVLTNVGGGRAGDTDLATIGSPAKFSFCFAENEAESPWPPYHTSLGYDAADSTVSVLSAEGPHNLNDHVSNEPTGLLTTFAQSMATMGTNNAYLHNTHCFVILGLEHARILAAHEWTRADLQHYLFARARIPYRTWKLGGMTFVWQARHLQAADDDFLMPIAAGPDNFRIAVAGGLGRHSCWIPAFNAPSVTHLIRAADGRPWRPLRPISSLTLAAWRHMIRYSKSLFAEWC